MIMDEHPGRQLSGAKPALAPFTYRNGYILSASDLGKGGVKLTLSHDRDSGAAIILPPDKVHECGRWLLQTMQQDVRGLPVEIRDILRRVTDSRSASRILRHGDKKKIRDALRVLRE
ncbi:MAG: hypothetical protein JSU70_01210 [Phycisphaerales bacterium]|nr:MAG: hypothetical protein JSU70_01210 [Phycisphaerales bacterium]